MATGTAAMERVATVVERGDSVAVGAGDTAVATTEAEVQDGRAHLRTEMVHIAAMAVATAAAAAVAVVDGALQRIQTWTSRSRKQLNWILAISVTSNWESAKMSFPQVFACPI